MTDCATPPTRNNFASRLLSKAINDRIKKGPFPKEEVTVADAEKFAVKTEIKEPVAVEA